MRPAPRTTTLPDTNPEPDKPRTFTQTLWDAAEPVHQAIRRHPFLLGMTSGQLPRSRFAFYILQDAIYLKEFAAALLALASNAPDSNAAATLARHAVDAVDVERALHDGLLAELGLHPEQIQAAEPAPANLAYTSYLLAVVRGKPFHEGLAAVLPCYWIYARVGAELLQKGSPDPLYQRWIQTYAGDDFERAVREVLAIADSIAPALAEHQRQAMIRRFRDAARYEWMFWDMANREETWPV